MLQARNVVVWLINVIIAVVAFFLGLRIIFQLFNANPATPFVSWIYDVSSALTAPFRGIFQEAELGAGSTVDVVAIAALVAYALIAYILIAIVNSVYHTATREEDKLHAHGHTR